MAGIKRKEVRVSNDEQVAWQLSRQLPGHSVLKVTQYGGGDFFAVEFQYEVYTGIDDGLSLVASGKVDPALLLQKESRKYRTQAYPALGDAAREAIKFYLQSQMQMAIIHNCMQIAVAAMNRNRSEFEHLIAGLVKLAWRE